MMRGNSMMADEDLEAEDDLASGALDVQAGYMIGIKVNGDGSITVCKKPLPTEEDSSAYQELSVESIEQALKAAIKIYKANPVGQDQHAQFAAGFNGLNQSKASEGHGLMSAKY